MGGLLKRLRRRLCRHPNKRAYDLSRTPEGAFRLRLYCPDCGYREDVLREPEEMIDDAAGENADLRETMRRNLDDR